MIRIHFSAADLGRVTFPDEPEPLWEAALAARALGDRAIPPVARRWRREAGRRVRPSMRPLFKLIAPAGQFPDFLTPPVPAPGLEPAVEALMNTPAAVVRDELGPWLPAEVDKFMQGLLAGRAGSRRALGIAVRDYADALADLLGRTRATVLRALTYSATTTQLSRRTGISLPSTSDHTRILRNAGLITTHRTNGTALHSLTPTAHHLLTGATRGSLEQITKTTSTAANTR